MLKYELLSRHERDQLRFIGSSVYGGLAPYWWGKKTMPKLAEKGLVEPHPAYPRAWRITEAGKALLPTASSTVGTTEGMR